LIGWYLLGLNVSAQLREFHARPFPQIIYATAPARKEYAHSAGVHLAKKIDDDCQLKVHS